MVKCGVFGCSNTDYTKSVVLHRIPGIRKMHYDITYNRYCKWLAALKIDNLSSSKIRNFRICGDHFISGKPADWRDINSPDWVPSKNLGEKVAEVFTTMPERCSIAGCRSNCGEDEYTTVFSLPKHEPLRSQWLQVIPTDFKGLENPLICIKHFKKQAIVWKNEILYKGEIKRYPCKVPKYRKGAIPTIFPNLLKQSNTPKNTTRRSSSLKRLRELKKSKIPKCKENSTPTISPFLMKYSSTVTGITSDDKQENSDLVLHENVKELSKDEEFGIISNLDEILDEGKFKKDPCKVSHYKEGLIPTIPFNLQKYSSTTSKATRHLSDVEEDDFNLTVKENIEELHTEKELNKITNFEDIVSYMKKRENTLKAWVTFRKQSSLALCLMNTEVECPVVSGCVIIAENLKLIVYLHGVKTDIEELPIEEKKISSVSVLEDILTFIENKE